MNENFDRRYKLRIGVSHSRAFEVGSISNESGAALHIDFSIEKSDSETSNTGTISIWNLNDSQLAVLQLENCEIELQAGYGNNLARIISGDVTHVSTSLDGADRKTEIEFVENCVLLKNSYITLSYAGNIGCKTIIERIASSLGIAVAYSQRAVFKSCCNGFSFVGAASAALSKICGICGLNWSIQNGVLQIFTANEAVNTKAYLLNTETGLVDVPKQVTFAASDGRDTLKGWEIKYLMNAAININDTVQIKSRAINGTYRVKELVISGDNFSGDWCCTAQIVEA